ncbi:hypothetical protein BWI93_23975 [Siphonobacter sp. BAB-5385]|nr:hypothetical protein BWI93_23975 [Siphonobacter sp. BAB-5385]
MDTAEKNITADRGSSFIASERRNSIARLRQFARFNKRFTGFHLILAYYGLIILAGMIYQIARHFHV